MKNNEKNPFIEEIKTLVMIGGIPCVIFLLSWLFTKAFFSTDSVTGLYFIGFCVGAATLYAIYLVICRMIEIYRNMKR